MFSALLACFLLLFSVREEVCQSRGGPGAGIPVQTVQGEQRLRPLEANGCPPPQKGEQPEQEQHLCTGEQLTDRLCSTQTQHTIKRALVSFVSV